MFVENNIYKSGSRTGNITRGGLSGLSSRQQVLFLMQKTQKEANWNMENDSDFQEDYSNDNKGNTVSVAGESTLNYFDQADIMGMVSGTDLDLKTHSSKKQSSGRTRENMQATDAGARGGQLMTFNEEFEVKRELLRKSEIVQNPIRFRLLAYSLTQFVPLRKNKYLERKRYIISDHEAQNLVCTCERMTGKRAGNLHQSYNCGDSCLNRAVSFECCTWTCPSGPYCKNRKFQLHQNAYVYPVKTEFKGWGLLAGEFIKKESFIMQYVGEIFSVDSDLGQERVNMYKNSTCTYLMKTTANEVIDPTFQGNIARFINHSCDPNCETKKWTVLGEVCVGIFAKRDIKENEELTFDYQFDFFKTPFTKCYCGAANCKGYLGVLATNVSSVSALNPQISAPECNYCKNLITDKESLMMCKGPNKETYHIPCVIKKEGGNNKQRIQQFSKQLDSKNFICRICRIQEKKSGKNERSQDDSSSDVDMISEPQPESLYPWECQNPDVLRFYDNSQDNQILDQIIQNELDSLEKEYEMNSLKKKPSHMQRGADNFSSFYNFMSDLQKRLKQRIKQQKKQAGTGLIKFRRTKEMVFKNKLADNNEPIKQKRNRRRTGRSAAVKSRQSQSISRPRAKRQRSQAINEASMEHVTQREPQEQLKDEEEERIVSEEQHDHSMSDKQSEEGSNQQQLIDASESQSQDQESSNHPQDDDYDNLIQNDEQEIELELDQEDDEVLDLEEGEIVEGEEEEESECSEDSDQDSSSNSDELDEEEEEEEYEQDREELNLEQLQQNQESHSEDEERKSSSSESLSDHKNYYSEVRKRAIKIIQNKTKQREEIKQGQGRRNSLILQKSSSEDPSDQQTLLTRIQSEVSQQIDKFVKFQNSQAEFKSEQNEVSKETKLNTFETVFNLAVPEYIEDYQCLPNFQIFWEQPWGGMVTVKIVSTFKQYQFFTQLLQSLTDQLLQKGMLQGFYQVQHYQVKEPPQQYPFEILIIQVPKNFIRKIVGYQEKNLNTYRKIYSVDFDFSKDLLSDDVYGMNETTQLRVFGNSRDARYVNELILKDLESIKMKTIFMQMSECKVIMDHVKEVKVQVDPCEIRIKKLMRDWKDLRHPFYYLPNYSREMVLIGSSQEIEMAERIIEKFLQIKREQQMINLQQLCYLLPIQFKMNHQIIKNELIQKYGQQNLQVYFYEPTFPRKHMTVLLIGDWKLLLDAKKTLQQEVDKYINPASLEKNFENFQQFTYHQQLRFSFKSLKRFVLEQDIKYLNHWDMVSPFIENMASQKESVPLKGKQMMLSEDMKKREEEHKADIEAFIKYIREDDVETCINSLFVLTESKPDILERLMRSMHVRKRDLIDMMMQVLKNNYQSYNDALTFGSSKHFYRPYFSFQNPYWEQNQSQSKFFKPFNQNLSQSFELPSQPQLVSSQSEPQPYYKGTLQPLKLKSRSRSPSQKVPKYQSNNDEQEYQKKVENKPTSAENRFDKHSLASPSDDQYHHRSKHHFEDNYHHRKYDRESSAHRHHHRRSPSSSKRRRRERSSDRYYDQYHRQRDHHKQKHYIDEQRYDRRDEDPRKSGHYHHRKHSHSLSHSRSRSRFAKFDSKHNNEYRREEIKYHPQQSQNFEPANQQLIRRDNPHIRHGHHYQHDSPSEFHQSPPQIVQGQQKLTFDKPPHLMQEQLQIHLQTSQDNRMGQRQPPPIPYEDQRGGRGGYHNMYHQQQQPRSRSRDRRQPPFYHHQEQQRKRSRSRDRRRSRESSHSRGRGRFQHYQPSRGHITHENPYVPTHHPQYERRRSRSRSSHSRYYGPGRNYHHRDEKLHHEERGRDLLYHKPEQYNRDVYNQNYMGYHQENRERSPPNQPRYEDYRMKPGGSNYFRAPYQQLIDSNPSQQSFQRPSSFNMNKQGEDDSHQYHSHHQYHQRGNSSHRGYNRSGQQN